MKNGKKWKYKICGDKIPVILMFIMSVLFIGVSIWLYISNNGAFIFTSVIAGLTVLIFVLSAQCAFFYKVLVGTNGFYYQTNITNGKFYAYKDIEKIYTSSGTATNGVVQNYCNITTANQKKIRIMFFYCDEKAIKYMIKQVEKTRAEIPTEADEYLINDSELGQMSFVFSIIMIAIVSFIDYMTIKHTGINFVAIAGSIIMVFVLYLVVSRHFWFVVRIEKNGFYLSKNPFDGHYYKYSEIKTCREIKKVYRHRGRHPGRRYYFYFEFTDAENKTKKFLFNKPVYEYEINILKKRIENS